MNKEYIKLNNGKAIVIDDKGNKKIENMYDNIGEVLAQENIVETIKNNIKTKQEKIKVYKTKKRHYKFLKIISIIIYLFAVFAFGVFSGILSRILANTVINIFGVSLILVAIVTHAYIYNKIHKNIYKYNKELSAYKEEVDYLEETLMKQKETLRKLKTNKTYSNTNNKIYNEVKELNDLKKLKRRLKILHELEINKEKYIKNMKKGKFDSVYNNSFNDAKEFDFAKRYVKKMYYRNI